MSDFDDTEYQYKTLLLGPASNGMGLRVVAEDGQTSHEIALHARLTELSVDGWDVHVVIPGTPSGSGSNNRLNFPTVLLRRLPVDES